MPKSKRSAKPKPVSVHALDQLAIRCGLCLSVRQVLQRLQSSELLYRSPNGDCRFFRVGQRFAVAVVRNKTVVTFLAMEQAFANCPPATFHALVSRGELAAAIKLRCLLAKGSLPEPHGKDVSNYKYNKVRAKYLWDAFAYLDKDGRVPSSRGVLR
jgi:hypothetical protein